MNSLKFFNALKSKKYFKIILSFLKIAIIVIPFVWIYFKLDLQTLAQSIKSISPNIIILAVLLIYVSMFLQGFRWWLLLRSRIPHLPLLSTMRIHFLGLFYGISLPSSAGLDLVRAILISKNIDYGIVIGATWLCRLFGFLALIVLSISGLMLSRTNLLPNINVIPYIISFAAILILLFIISFSKRFTRPLRFFLNSKLPQNLLNKIENVRNGIYIFKENKKALITVFIITVIMQFLMSFNAALIIYGVSKSFHLIECITFIPMIEIICLLLPFTPNGIGIRETITYFFLKNLNLTDNQIIVYISIGFLTIILKLTGIIFTFKRRNTKITK